MSLIPLIEPRHEALHLRHVILLCVRQVHWPGPPGDHYYTREFTLVYDSQQLLAAMALHGRVGRVSAHWFESRVDLLLLTRIAGPHGG